MADEEKIRTTVYWDRVLYEQMQAVAKMNRRTLNAEFVVAAEEHIKRESRKRDN